MSNLKVLEKKIVVFPDPGFVKSASPIRRHAHQLEAKPLDQGIFTEITQVLQAAAPDQNQNYYHQDHVDGPVVSSHIITRKYRLDSAVKVDDPKVSPNQLQPSVGGDVLRCKFDVQKALAWKKKIGSTQSHLEWPPLQGGLVGVATALSPATCRPFQVF